MDRRTFNKLASFTALAALAESADLSAAQAAAVAGEVVLEDADLVVAFDPVSGALTRLERKSTNWSIQRRPALGISFRLHAPLPNRRDNFVLGSKQRAVSVQKIAPDQVRLQWANLVSEHGGTLPITFTATATLRNGVLTFTGTLQNDSDLSVETLDYPYLGDLSAPTPDPRLTTEHMWYGNLVGDEIYPQFRNEKGYWGVDFPTKTAGTNQSLLFLIQSPDQGLYVGMHDATLPYYLEFTTEQHPGVIQSVDSSVPRTDEISDEIGRRQDAIGLRRVDFRCAEPQHCADYRLFFGAPVRFDQKMSCLAFDERFLKLPVVRNERALKQFLGEAPANILVRYSYDAGLSASIRRRLFQGIPRSSIQILVRRRRRCLFRFRCRITGRRFGDRF